MRTLAFAVLAALVTAGPVLAEPADHHALDEVGKQLLRDAATKAAPREAVEGAKTVEDAAGQANELKESAKSAPAAVKGQLQKAATESARRQVEEVVPEQAKEGMRVVESTAKSAKSIKKRVEAAPKSAGEASQAAKDKVREEATKKALDMLP
ncbi:MULTISPECIES: hypothetical protein [Methylococcus]|jgi:hypothetical protein|uniref:hypothetical protein n=1 Tax=Methylococcus TaxID=413 RepID=UPI001C52E7AB|nr:hypothetical protein [Methylococcus capsulatus]QXP90335.1 hypothetical protein KW114_15065 [Methylococcus capsulatus]